MITFLIDYIVIGIVVFAVTAAAGNRPTYNWPIAFIGTILFWPFAVLGAILGFIHLLRRPDE